MRDRVFFEADIDDDIIEYLSETDLPADWRDLPASRSTQRIGDEWVASGRSAVLCVPSVVVPGHFNFLLNPSHPDYSRIVIRGPHAVNFDPRLI